MTAIRLFLAQRHLAAILCVAALLMKLLVPGGYMVDSQQGRFTVMICSGVESRMAAMEIPGMHGDMPGHGGSKDLGKAEMPCAFSGLSAATLGAVDPVLLVALIAFVMAAGRMVAAVPILAAPLRLRPPLRGPPAYP